MTKGVWYVCEKRVKGWTHYHGPFSKKEALAFIEENEQWYENRSYELIR